MAICGYNEKIGEGLRLLIEGMAMSMQEKADRLGTIQALDDELYELSEMIKRMQGKGPVPEIFIGLDIFAERFFAEVKKVALRDNTAIIADIMADMGPRFIATIKYAEAYRGSFDEANLRNKDVQPIHLVADWVNEHPDGISENIPVTQED